MNTQPILLATLNSTYQHSAFGLRYILAQMGPLKAQTEICEFTIKETPRNIVEILLNKNPQIVGFGIYIWNTLETLEVISLLKRVAPHVTIVIGGPEITYETETQPHLKYADYVIKGEADFAFRELCLQLIAGQKPEAQIQQPLLPSVSEIILPYREYTDTDILQRYIYVEASRGCPYKCEYCLSSLDKSVRSFDLSVFMAEMKLLMERGARHFKFVDRTFNLSPTTSTTILNFFLKHIDKGLFLHFELVPDRLPLEIRNLIKQFPAGSLQFEVGLQTLNPVVAQNVSRKNDLKKVAENLAYLKQETHVHTHADLIVGLQGETDQRFADGFDQLHAWQPDEIQVGLLKRLKGTPIRRHEEAFKLIYSERPPFQIASTSTMTFIEMQAMTRFAKYWDLYANSGEFKNFMQWCLHPEDGSSAFRSFESLVEWITQDSKETFALSLMSLAEKAYRYMLSKNVSEEVAREMIEKDYCFGTKRRDLPPFLKNTDTTSQKSSTASKAQMNKRQLNHLHS